MEQKIFITSSFICLCKILVDKTNLSFPFKESWNCKQSILIDHPILPWCSLFIHSSLNIHNKVLFWILFRYQHFAYHIIFYLLSSKTQFLVYICLNCTCRLWHCDYFCSCISSTVPTLSYHNFIFFHTVPSSRFPFPSRALFRAHQIVQKEINLTKIAHSLVDQTNLGSIKAICCLSSFM